MATKKPLFELLDHCCSVCGGRILLRSDDAGQYLRCAECGAEAQAAVSNRTPYTALCFCGVRLGTGADAGLRCKRAAPSPERPNEIVVHHVPHGPGRRPSVTPKKTRPQDDD